MKIVSWYVSYRVLHIVICIVSLGDSIVTAPANSVDPDQLASSEANWSGSALFAFEYLN